MSIRVYLKLHLSLAICLLGLAETDSLRPLEPLTDASGAERTSHQPVNEMMRFTQHLLTASVPASVSLCLALLNRHSVRHSLVCLGVCERSNFVVGLESITAPDMSFSMVGC